MFTLLDLCVSSLRRGHANFLCIAPILTDDPRRESLIVDTTLKAVLPASVKKTLLRKTIHVEILAFRASNQGLDCSFCRWVAGHGLAEKNCVFHRHRHLELKAVEHPGHVAASRRRAVWRWPCQRAGGRGGSAENMMLLFLLIRNGDPGQADGIELRLV